MRTATSPSFRSLKVKAMPVRICVAAVLLSLACDVRDSGAPAASERPGHVRTLAAAEPVIEKKAGNPEDAPESEGRRTEREENLKAMQQRAAGMKIRLAGQEKRTGAELIARPLFHYTDQPRRIIDATL